MPEEGVMTRVPQQRSGVVTPHRLPWPGRAVVSVVSGLARAFAATVPIRMVQGGEFLEEVLSRPGIFCAWHNRLALSMQVYNRMVRRQRPGRRMAAMVSASKDGAWLAAVLEEFEVQPVRGSSSRRGPQALRELVTWAGKGFDLAITPDGPRGPFYRVQTGVMALAQLSGLPIVPTSYSLDRKVVLKSWDRFQVPLPFGACGIRVGRPMLVPRELSAEDREAMRLELESRMMSITVD